jgi:hypothetical protein
MAASEGVDLEWAIVEFSRGDKPSRKYSSKIKAQAEKCVRHIKSKFKKFEIYHSDESIPGVSSKGIYANPEPKTDIVIIAGGKKYFVSVKMEGGIQLSSGQGRSTAELFRAAADTITNTSKKKVLSQIIANMEELPTRLMSQSNMQRILQEGNKKVIEEFISSGKIRKEKNYEDWLQNKKPELMADLVDFVEKNPEFYEAIIREALTGEKTLKQYKGAVANSVISPAGFHIIDAAYVKKVKSKIKMDIRAKSRGGVTSIAFRIETKGSL